jgi:hypothetical protein
LEYRHHQRISPIDEHYKGFSVFETHHTGMPRHPDPSGMPVRCNRIQPWKRIAEATAQGSGGLTQGGVFFAGNTTAGISARLMPAVISFWLEPQNLF